MHQQMCQGIQQQLKQLGLIQQSVLTSDQGEGAYHAYLALWRTGLSAPLYAMYGTHPSFRIGAGGMGNAYRQMNLTRIDSTAETLR